MNEQDWKEMARNAQKEFEDDETLKEIRKAIEGADEETQYILLMLVTRYYAKAIARIFQENHK